MPAEGFHPNSVGKAAVDTMVAWLRAKAEDRGATGGIVCFDGSRNALVAMALVSEAFGRENTVGVILPDRSVRSASPLKDMSDMCSEYCDTVLVTTIGKGRAQVLGSLCHIDGFNKGPTALISDLLTTSGCGELEPNTAIRNAYMNLYSMCHGSELLTVGTLCLDDDWVGYRFRGNGLFADIMPLGRLTHTEISQLGLHLGLSMSMMDLKWSHRDPNTNMTDLDTLGGPTFKAADTYIRGDGPVRKDWIPMLVERHAAAGPLRCRNCFDPGLPIAERTHDQT